ncbi:MAG: HNH endonuclease signature motif containing protein [Bryobacteraceae bacterium]
MISSAEAVRRRAGNRCEYCRLPQIEFRRKFHIEHIVARQHGGSTGLDNLALACWSCNLKKGPTYRGSTPRPGIRLGSFIRARMPGRNTFPYILAPLSRVESRSAG